ncbi:MAG: MFS transporter [Phenylobacterium sp.]|uniref:MFS transporter n=1 Tax=Phenylobacterium sp. TaxID=1871053 RepID=UPI002733048E|nr:MFS transporter [Phenylobacterium sp.]MDP3176224.1 MFS transporter [Phenylobacterium sp.]
MTSSESDPGSRSAQPSLFSPLNSRVFRAVWIASLASNFGYLIQSVGASWLMTSISSPMMVALVQASVTLPIMLLSLPAGALADTFDRRKLMLGAQGFMLAVSITLSICTFSGLITPWVLLMFTFLIGCGSALNGPAWQASVGEMVPRQEIAGAVALNSMGFNLARTAGPAIGGMIVAAAGAAAAFTVNVFSYVGLMFVLARWRPQREAQTLPREALGVAMSAGFRYVMMSGRIGSVLLRAFVFGVGASAVQSLMPLIARDALGGGPRTFGILLGAFGVGAVAAAAAMTKLRGRFSNELIVRYACLVFSAATIALALTSWLVVAVIVLAVGGGGWVLAMSTFNVTTQMSAPRWVVARALAFYQVAAFGGMALGSWLWGMVAEYEGLKQALFVSGGLQFACALIGLRFPLASTSDLSLDPSNRWQEPNLAVDIQPTSGPVIITVQYLIDAADIDAFLAAMAERRRIRRRDGARNWRLMRDLADPRVWIERYQTPTWVDYVRHNQRPTEADRVITDRVLALHRGGERPVVHRMIERQTRVAHHEAINPQGVPDPLTDPTHAA